MYFFTLASLFATALAAPTSSPNQNSTTLATSSTNSTHSLNTTSNVPTRKCGVAAPSTQLLEAHQEIKTSFRKRSSPRQTQYVVDTVFHIVSTQDQANFVTKSMIANQFGALQSAYASSNISFRLVSVDYTVNDTWAADTDSATMKATLRKGGYSTLNIYFQSNLSSTYAGQSSQLLGYCTLPTNITYSPCDGCDLAVFPAENYNQDGCNVHSGSMPNNWLQGYNMGKTAVHEVGHWFGLLHTFQGESCDSDNPGDYIDDTVQESESTDGCPAQKKSCPDCPGGMDPIHNYMDYSSDACYEGFTPEQIDRMHAMYGSMRNGY